MTPKPNGDDSNIIPFSHKDFSGNTECFAGLEGLSLGNVSDLSFLSMMPGIKYLSLHICVSANLNPIKTLAHLNHLKLSGVIADLSPISSLKNLTILELENLIADFSPLIRMTFLHELRISKALYVAKELKAIVEILKDNGVYINLTK